MNEKQPTRFTHDCDQCVWLGQFNEFDLYYCAKVKGLPTVIARYGDAGVSYISGLRIDLPEIGEAKARAIEYLQNRVDAGE